MKLLRSVNINFTVKFCSQEINKFTTCLHHCLVLSFFRLKEMVAEMDIAAANKLKNNAQPGSMVHNIMIATFMVLGDDNENAKVYIKIISNEWLKIV